LAKPVNNTELGRRIKQLRLSQGYTLKDIEAKVGVSATHVSEVERGKTSPTVGALTRIADALDVNPSYLVDLPVGSEVSFTSVGDRVALKGPRDSASWDVLTTENSNAELSMFVLRLEADMKQPLLRDPRPGDKFLHVIDGILELELREEKHPLRTGDSIHFKSSHPLKIVNLSEGETQLFWVDWPRLTL
jgi:transcriptional regulator with XRE-family HTH domain